MNIRAVGLLWLLAPTVQTMDCAEVAVAGKSASVDYTRYFASPDTERQGRRELTSRTEVFIRKPSWTVQQAARELSEAAVLKTQWMRHVVYCELRSADDADDHEAADCLKESNSRKGALGAFVDKQLQEGTFVSISEKDITQGRLEPYRYLISQAKERSRHSLDPAEEKLLDEYASPLLQQWSDRYDALVRQIKSEVTPIATSAGPLHPIKDAQRIGALTDRTARETAVRVRSDAYATHREVIAATLLDTVRMESALAKLRHYPTAPERKYERRLQLTETEVKAMLDSVRAHADILQNYQRLRAERVSALTGIKDVHSWDLSVTSGYAPEKLSFEQARRSMLAAVAPLGSEYASRFGGLIDPANGELDISGGPRREPGGFSVGFSGVPVSLYVDEFNGDLNSIAQIIHEAGHAVHRKLMNDAGVSPYYAEGPNFLSEAYAILNELLFWHVLEEKATTAQEKVYFRERLVGEAIFQVFTSAEEGALEQALYDGVAARTVRNADDIDKLNGEILRTYDLFAANEPLAAQSWMRKRLLIEDPLYLVTYLYAGLVACKLFQMSEENPADFQKRYRDLLRSAFDASASELVERNMGFKLDGASLLDGALGFIKTETAALERAYRLQP